MKKIKKILILIFLTIFFINCSSIENPVQTMKSPQKSNLTIGTIKNKIVENKTTQEEVMILLGAPNLVTRNSKGNRQTNLFRHIEAFGEKERVNLETHAKIAAQQARPKKFCNTSGN